MGDDPRDIILSRRARFLAAALAGVTTAASCGSEVTVPGDGDGGADTTTAGPTGAGGAQVCLSAGGAEPCLGAPRPEGGGGSAGEGGSGGAGGSGG